jgi:hypothetical protein
VVTVPDTEVESAVDLSHLHEAAQRVARLPADKRLRHIAGRSMD